MLFLERVSEFLDQKNDIGMVFGDYEQDEVARSVLDFSQFKASGKTSYAGRTLGRLVDTIYATHSHYSRFLQAADMVCFLCQRYESGLVRTNSLDQALGQIWQGFKTSVDYKMKDWP